MYNLYGKGLVSLTHKAYLKIAGKKTKKPLESGKGMWTEFTLENANVPMYIKISSTSHIVKKSYSYTEIPFLTYLISKNPNVWQRATGNAVRIEGFSHVAGETQRRESTVEEHLAKSSKLTLWPSNPMSRIARQRYAGGKMQSHMNVSLHCSTIYDGKTWKTTEVAMNRALVKLTMLHWPQIEYHTAMKGNKIY